MTRFFKCDVCGKVVAVVEDGMGTSTCCGKNMRELVPGTVDASLEKHVPTVNVAGTEVTVNVGSVNHPMEKEHHISWICLETCCGVYLKYLKVGSNPTAVFNLANGERLKTVYAYCNLHGLWSAEMK